MKRQTEFLPRWTVYDDEPYPGPMEDDEIVGVAVTSSKEPHEGVDIKWAFHDDLTDPIRNMIAGINYIKSLWNAAAPSTVVVSSGHRNLLTRLFHDQLTCEDKTHMDCQLVQMNLKLREVGVEVPDLKKFYYKPDLEKIRQKYNHGPGANPFKRLGR